MYGIKSAKSDHITIVNDRRLPIKVVRPATKDALLLVGFVEIAGTRTKDFAGNEFFDVLDLRGE